MPKATSLMPEALEPQRVVTPLAATKQRGQKAKTEKMEPLQIRIPLAEIKAIKMAALADDFPTVSDFMLTCFHAYMEKRKNGSMQA
jgi:NRPS condensation-like uncharacterized protein